MGKNFYYGGAAGSTSAVSLESYAAKIPSDGTLYSTPKTTRTVSDHYKELNAPNYYYLAPYNDMSYGTWGNHSLYGIAKNCFKRHITTTSEDYIYSTEFVSKYSAPVLKLIDRDRSTTDTDFDFLSPFKSSVTLIGDDSSANARKAKITWDATTNRIVVAAYSYSGEQIKKFAVASYGLFILLAGAGGGGGGADQNWGRGAPGAGGGGGGATVLVYVDIRSLYALRRNGYIEITAGQGGAGGQGGTGTKTSGANGGATTLYFHDGVDYCYYVSAGGGYGGAWHSWDAAADSTGGNGGVTLYGPMLESSSSKLPDYIKVLTYVNGGAGGAGRLGSSGDTGATVEKTGFKTPFTTNWTSGDSITVTKATGVKVLHTIGAGTSNRSCGGGGGGSAAFATDYRGFGLGGQGGYVNEDGYSGADGGCLIFSNCIVGIEGNEVEPKTK